MITAWLTDQCLGNKRVFPSCKVFALAIISIAILFLSCQKTETSKYPNGQVKFILHKNEQGKLHGESKYWYENGNLMLTADYTNGIIDGKLARYREDGTKLTEDVFVNGKLNGVCHEFHYNGNVLSEMPYVNDTLHGMSRQLDDVGQVMIEGMYEHGYFEGKWTYYNRSGDIIGEADFKEGTGVKKSYDVNGNVIGIAEFKDNLQHGKEIWYSTSGKLVRTRYYDHGDLVEYVVESPVDSLSVN